MLACFVARELGMTRIVVPLTPGVLSAFGGLIADIKNDFIKTIYADLDRAGDTLCDGFAALRRQAERWLRDEQGYSGTASLLYTADMRYRGQSFEIETVLEEAWIKDRDLAAIADAFHAEHARVYGHGDPAANVQIINLRLVIVAAAPQPEMQPLPAGGGAPQTLGEIEVYYDGAMDQAALYDRKDLLAGQRIAGPAVIQQDDATTVVLGGFDGKIDSHGNIVLTRGER